MGMTIKFIDTDQTLLKVLLVSRDFNEVLKDVVLKQSLMRASQERLTYKRQELWLRILDIDKRFIKNEYDCYKQ